MEKENALVKHTQMHSWKYLYPIEAVEKMGSYIAKSGLFGVKTPEQAIALMLIAQAEGRHPASAAQDYHVIQNRPSLKADTMLARFQQAGGVVEWIEYKDTRVIAKFSHLQGGSVTVDWDMDRAKRAGLGAKDNWKNYPRAMLRARVISEGIRTVYPAVLGGMYTPEEVMDFEPLPAAPEPPPAKAAPPPRDIEAEFITLLKKEGIPSVLAEEYLEMRSAADDTDIASLKAKAVNRPGAFRKALGQFVQDAQQGPETVDADTAGMGDV